MVGVDLDRLRGALRLICPRVDLSWLLTIAKRIAAAAPCKSRKYHLVTSDRLYALGVELMDAVAASEAAKRISKAHAFEYRDGLVIALAVLIPLRPRTLVALRIGKQLVKTGDLWVLWCNVDWSNSYSGESGDAEGPRALMLGIVATVILPSDRQGRL
jgi:hypothetical protein